MSEKAQRPRGRRELQASRFDKIAGESASLGEHARVAAAHCRSGEIPRAAAHALALEGHLVTIRETLNDIAKLHGSRSRAVR